MNAIYKSLFGLMIIGLVSCQRYVCPAYQSAFYLTDAVQQERFSDFGQDSMPASLVDVRKGRHLIVAPMGNRKKRRSMYTVRAEKVFTDRADTLRAAPAEQ